MTLNDKRTIISSKRARNKRKKAQRSMAKALASHSPTDGSGDEAAASVSVAETADTLGDVRRSDDHGETDDEQDDDDDEIVFVCRPTMQDFCTEFVPTAHAYMARDSSQTVSAWADLRKFTVRIPAFRETRDGYTTYSIVVTTTGDWRKQYQLERRYSEFVAFAAGLDEYFQSSHYQQLREKLGRATRSSDVKDEAETDGQAAGFQWELPPKTWFRMTQTTALEERRSKLEASLHTLLAHDPRVVCQIPLVRDFLMLDMFGAQVVEEKMQRV